MLPVQITTEDTRLVTGEIWMMGQARGGDRALALLPGPAASRRDWSLPLQADTGLSLVRGWT